MCTLHSTKYMQAHTHGEVPRWHTISRWKKIKNGWIWIDIHLWIMLQQHSCMYVLWIITDTCSCRGSDHASNIHACAHRMTEVCEIRQKSVKIRQNTQTNRRIRTISVHDNTLQYCMHSIRRCAYFAVFRTSATSYPCRHIMIRQSTSKKSAKIHRKYAQIGVFCTTSLHDHAL